MLLERCLAGSVHDGATRSGSAAGLPNAFDSPAARASGWRAWSARAAPRTVLCGSEEEERERVFARLLGARAGAARLPLIVDAGEHVVVVAALDLSPQAGAVAGEPEPLVRLRQRAGGSDRPRVGARATTSASAIGAVPARPRTIRGATPSRFARETIDEAAASRVSPSSSSRSERPRRTAGAASSASTSVSVRTV